MAENRNCNTCGNPVSYGRDTVCIDCNRILDGCKDKDCFTDTRVLLTDFGQQVLERASSVRVKTCELIGCNVRIEPIQFNCGFYTVTVRYFAKLVCEFCVGTGRVQEAEGIAVCEKKVILYGSEGNVNIFKSDCAGDGFCSALPAARGMNNLPVAVVETVDPVVLGIRIATREPECGCGCGCGCCCSVCEVPENICGCLNGNLIDPEEGRRLLCTLGYFSVIRIERPGKFAINATEYSLPDKICTSGEDDDPCVLFEKMSFPVGEFSPPPLRSTSGSDCNRNR